MLFEDQRSPSRLAVPDQASPPLPSWPLRAPAEVSRLRLARWRRLRASAQLLKRLADPLDLGLQFAKVGLQLLDLLLSCEEPPVEGHLDLRTQSARRTICSSRVRNRRWKAGAMAKVPRDG